MKDKITEAMTWLGKQEKSVFIGEGLKNAGGIYGTMNHVPTQRCLEMPIVENLIAGGAVGLAAIGFIPILVFQRMDFMLIASDAIINHIALIPKMSNGQFPCHIIIRAIIGSTRTSVFDVGPQHNHDLIHMFRPYISTIVIEPKDDVLGVYQELFKLKEPTLVIERKDDYNG